MSEAAIKRMANQIAANLKRRSDSIEAIRAHLKSFWTPQMIEELKSFASKNPQELDDLIVKVAQEL